MRGHVHLAITTHRSHPHAMNLLTRTDLMSLETYARERARFRARVLAHKKNRIVHVGAHVTLVFEDRMTIQYQVQEMLRIEKLFEADAIQDELDAYNPLIPDGGNLKATMLIEYDDVEERRRELARLGGIEHRVRLVVAGHAPIVAHADEDLDRSTEDKTSAVHFLRFEIDPAARADLAGGAALTITIDHPRYQAAVEISGAIRSALLADFELA
jgi:hypothetical protein